MGLGRAPVRMTEEQRAAATLVLTEHREGLWRLALLVAGSAQAAEDLLATAIAQALPYLHRVDTSAAIYLRTVMLRLRASDWQRRNGIQDQPWAQVPDRPAEVDEAGAVAGRADIAAALQVLGPRQRSVVVLRYLEDRPVAEVARILGCSEVTVRTQAHRALQTLRTEPWLLDSSGPDRPTEPARRNP